MLGLCDYPFTEQEPDEDVIAYHMGDYTGTDLMNLLRMISARQLLLNRALDVRGAFFVDQKLILHHNDLRERFCEEFNRIVEEREKYLSVWMRKLATGTALEKVRARQMIEITAGGKILYEVLELAQAILQEAWVETDGRVSFIMHVDTTVNRDDIFTTDDVSE